MSSRPRVVNKLPELISQLERQASGAVLQALIHGGAEAAAFTPQHTSNLINSQFKRVEKQGTRIVGTVGYTAAYALAVHEATAKLRGLPRPKEDGRAQGNFWDPRGEPHFLRLGFEQAEPKIRELIRGAFKPR